MSGTDASCVGRAGARRGSHEVLALLFLLNFVACGGNRTGANVTAADTHGNGVKQSPSPAPALAQSEPGVPPQAGVDGGSSAYDAAVSSAAAASALLSEPSVNVAREFIAAIRENNRQALQGITLIPFQLKDTGAAASCVSGSAATQEELANTVSCLLNDDLLREELRAIPEPEMATIPGHELPAWARKFRAGRGKGRTLVSVYIPGGGVTYYFIVVVESGAVRELWKHAVFDAN